MNDIAVKEAVEVRPATGTAAPLQAHVLASHGLACNRLDALRKLHRKHIDWHIRVQAHLYHGAKAPDVSKMPGKPAKHRMYEAANWFLAHYGIDLPRPTTLAAVGAVLVAAEIRLAGLDKDHLDTDA